MSPRAAWRLESLGFTEVYEYSAGKSDWAAYRLPLEGKALTSIRIKDIARADVPTCRLDDKVSSARQRAGDCATCILVNEEDTSCSAGCSESSSRPTRMLASAKSC